MNRKVIVVTGHSKLDSGGVGTHIKLLIDELKNTNSLTGVVLGGGINGKIFHGVNKVLSRFLKVKYLYESTHLISNIFFIEKGIEKEIVKNGKDELYLIHSHDRSSTIAAHRLKHKYNLKIIQTLHAPFYQQYEIHPIYSKSLVPNFIRGLDDNTVDYADVYIAVDQLQKQLILRDFGHALDENKICIIHNAVEGELLSLAKESSDSYFVVARHLHEKNGVEFSIKAFSQFVKLTGDNRIKLKILGQGPMLEPLKVLTDKLNLTDRVEFLGAQPRNQCVDIINTALASIVPSVPVGDYIEATSLTMLESMALNTPLIASNIGGIKDVLDNNDAAYLTMPSDVDEISKAMVTIFNQSKDVKIKILNARKIIESGYLSQQWIRRIEDAYNK